MHKANQIFPPKCGVFIRIGVAWLVSLKCIEAITPLGVVAMGYIIVMFVCQMEEGFPVKCANWKNFHCKPVSFLQASICYC